MIPRTSLNATYRWPKDTFGNEVDVGNLILFVCYQYGAEAAIGQITRVTKTGVPVVQTVKLHAKDSQITCMVRNSFTKLSDAMVDALILDKLSI